MPPKRSSSGTGSQKQQSTLAFHGASNKVIKAGTRAQNAKNLVAETKIKEEKPDVDEIDKVKLEEVEPTKIKLEEAEPTEIKLEEAEPTTIEAAIIDQTKQEVAAPQIETTPEEEQARRITDAAIKKYWAAKEKQRVTPRVHQQDVSLHEKILREFDMSGHYGPCTGIARLKRWKRAHRLDLDPPIEVLAVLLKEEDLVGKEKLALQQSHVDELLNAKLDVEA